MDRMIHILVVEDEEKIRLALKDFLEFKGFEVFAATDGYEAKAAVEREQFDLILLDLMLPKISGEKLCAMWRQQDIQTPVIMLTAKGREKDKIAGLNSGADDYITKPFSLDELLARVNAVQRRIDPARSVGTCFTFGGWQVDIPELSISRDNVQRQITAREAAIIQYFAANPGRIITREELYRQVWDDDMTGVETRTTDMHIAKLRSKIETHSGDPQIIVTVRGAGYKYLDE